MNAAALADLAGRLLVRAVSGDFQKNHASDDERQQMTKAPQPVADPLAQDYVAWRRAALWVGGVLLGAGAILGLVEHQGIAEQFTRAQLEQQGQQAHGADLQNAIQQTAQQIGANNVAIFDGLMDFLLFLKISVAVLAITAAWQWLQVKRSRAMTRWALITALVVPLLVSAWPWAQFLDFDHLQGQLGEGVKQLKAGIALVIASTLVSTVAPKLIALFPGIIRSAMTLKTLLPEATTPGWLVVVFGPFLVGFLLLVVCFMSQVQGSWLLLGGTVALVFGPVLYVRKAGTLVRPHTPEEVSSVVGPIRQLAGLGNAAGASLLAIYLFSLHEVSWTTAFHMLLEAGGGILLTMVAISDLTIALLAFSQRQGALFQGSAQRAQYERRLEALSGVGLTNLETALGLKDFAKLRKPGQD